MFCRKNFDISRCKWLNFRIWTYSYLEDLSWKYTAKLLFVIPPCYWWSILVRLIQSHKFNIYTLQALMTIWRRGFFYMHLKIIWRFSLRIFFKKSQPEKLLPQWLATRAQSRLQFEIHDLTLPEELLFTYQLLFLLKPEPFPTVWHRTDCFPVRGSLLGYFRWRMDATP